MNALYCIAIILLQKYNIICAELGEVVVNYEPRYYNAMQSKRLLDLSVSL